MDPGKGKNTEKEREREREGERKKWILICLSVFSSLIVLSDDIVCMIGTELEIVPY